MNAKNRRGGLSVTQNASIDFKSLFMEILDKSLVIFLSGIVAGLIAFLLASTVIHLNYESVTKVYVKPSESTGANSAYVSLEVGSLLTTDYAEMITGRDVIEDTILYFNLPTTYENFVHKVKVNNPTDTRILEISVQDQDPYMARNIAIYVRDKAINEIQNKMSNEGISIIQQANLPVRTVISKKLFAFIIGFLVMCFTTLFVIISFLVSDMIVTTDDVEQLFDLAVLGTLAYEKKDGRKR